MSEEALTHHDGSFIEELTITDGYQCQYLECQELHSLEISLY